MFLVTEYDLDSNGFSNNNITLYKNHTDAKKAFDVLAKKVMEDLDHAENIIERKVDNVDEFYRNLKIDFEKQCIISITYIVDNVECYRTYQDGSWKRPSGVELKVVNANINDDVIVFNNLFTYPPHRTYY